MIASSERKRHEDEQNQGAYGKHQTKANVGNESLTRVKPVDIHSRSSESLVFATAADSFVQPLFISPVRMLRRRVCVASSIELSGDRNRGNRLNTGKIRGYG